jgi:hypothetical protein
VLAAGPAVSIAPEAEASYQVHACGASAGGVSRAWAAVRTASDSQLTTFTRCPGGTPNPYESLEAGIGVVDTREAASSPPDDRYAEQRFAAPAGTHITGATVVRDIGNRDEYWEPYGRIDTLDQASETCRAQQGQAYCRLVGPRTFDALRASVIAYGLRCRTSWPRCINGWTLHEAWVLILSASVTLDDYEPPVVGTPSGDLADGSWKRGPGVLSFSASDNTGVRVRRLVEGARVLTSRTAPGAPAGCGDLNVGDAYTYVQPCAGARGLNGVQSVPVPDVCGWGDGEHVVRGSAVDTGGGSAVSTSSATVRVDCSVPVVSVAPATERRVAASAAVTPDVTTHDALSGVAATEVQVQAGLYGEWRALSEPVIAQAGAAYRFRARATDVAGNRSPWSAPSAWTVGEAVAGPSTPDLPMDVSERSPELTPFVPVSPPAPAAPAAAAPVSVDRPAAVSPPSPTLRAEPGAARLRSPRLTLLRRERGKLVIAGTADDPRVRLTVRSPRRPGWRLGRTLQVRSGAFSTRVRLPRALATGPVAVAVAPIDAPRRSTRRTLR